MTHRLFLSVSLLAASAFCALPKTDWLVDEIREPAVVKTLAGGKELELSNGLVRRQWRLAPNAATVTLDNLTSGQTLLRAVRPEAVVEIDGKRYNVGGLNGQPDHAYLRREWLDQMTADPQAFRFVSYEAAKTRERFPVKIARYSEGREWPAPGASLTLRFAAPDGEAKGIEVLVHYELYNGIPVFAKWMEVRNGTGRKVRLNSFTSEILAAVEYESQVESHAGAENPYLQVDSDYAFVATHPLSNSSKLAQWGADPLYTTQVNYKRDAPVLLEVRPPVGPNVTIEAGATFETFRAFELLHDSTERERRGLAQRRMYRVLAPWVTENPILMHVRQSDPVAAKLAIDQCARVGFEMVILSFGSGFNAENGDPAYLAQIADLVKYARSKGVELGGYSLLASRSVGAADDVINPKTNAPGGGLFGTSPCLGSRWSADYFRKLTNFFDKTGLNLLEHDGNYPGDFCASKTHPGHEGLEDSQWRQWQKITEFYRWCRARDIYLNVPDWYFLSGSNKNGMGYREVNWSLPRERQVILGRQNIFDGTWEKTPSMGWMFVPLVQYQGGGDAATLEPLRDHLDAYEAHLAQNFASGVQACYRGPRLFDAPETEAVVKKWVDFYKKHRAIHDSDIVHVKRADGRGLDVMLHVNPRLAEKGLAVIYNPLDHEVSETVTLPLYYTGLKKTAKIGARPYELDSQQRADVAVRVPAHGVSWLLVE